MVHESRRQIARAARDPRLLDAPLGWDDRVALEIRQPIAGSERKLCDSASNRHVSRG